MEAAERWEAPCRVNPDRPRPSLAPLLEDVVGRVEMGAAAAAAAAVAEGGASVCG